MYQRPDARPPARSVTAGAVAGTGPTVRRSATKSTCRSGSSKSSTESQARRRGGPSYWRGRLRVAQARVARPIRPNDLHLSVSTIDSFLAKLQRAVPVSEA